MPGTSETQFIAAKHEQARARAEELPAPVGEDELVWQVSLLMSPLGWDYAHIGHFEQLWLLRELGGRPPSRAEHDDVYDAFAHERSERGELLILAPPAARCSSSTSDAVRSPCSASWHSTDASASRARVRGRHGDPALSIEHTLRRCGWCAAGGVGGRRSVLGPLDGEWCWVSALLLPRLEHAARLRS